MSKHNLIWITAIIAASLVTLLVTRRNTVHMSSPDAGEFAPVAETYELISETYHEALDGNSLRRGAVNGMVSSLDEFSSYIAAERLDAFVCKVDGMGCGLGLRIDQTQGGLRVIGTLVNSPAHHEGISAGEIIVAIDGQSTLDMSLDDARAALDAPKGSPIELTFARGLQARETVTLTSSEFRLETVQGLYRDRVGRWVYFTDVNETIAYVRISEFVTDTATKLGEIIHSLGSIRGLVLDLRDNPGGRFAPALEVCDLFLAGGVIVCKVSRGEVSETHTARPNGTLPGFPVVVLINARTASSAEIVAGVLKFHDRAVVLGTRTRGKGAVQSMFPLPGDLGMINITTSQLLIGGTDSITRSPGSDLWGVNPHPGREVILSPAVTGQLEELRYRTEALALAKLPRPASAPTDAKTGDGPPAELMELDRQLVSAMELLNDAESIRLILDQAAAAKSAQPATATTQAKK